MFLVAFGLSYATAQRKNTVDQTKLTPEQRMVQRNAKHKNGGREADLAKKVQRAKKTDRAARKVKSPKKRKIPKG